MATRVVKTRFESEGAEKLAADYDKAAAAGTKLEKSSGAVAEALKKTNAAGEGLLPTARKLPKELQAIDNALQRVSDRGKVLPRDLNAINFALNRMRASADPIPGHLRAVNAGMADLRNTAVATTGRLGPLGAALAALGPAGLAAAAGAAGVVALGAGLVVFTKRALAAGDALADQARQVDINVETLQEYQYAARQSGVSNEALQSSLKIFTRTLGDAELGQGKLATALGKTDREFLRQVQTAGSVEASLDLMLRKIASVESPTQRAALANAAFGRSGQALLPILADGTAGLEANIARARELGLVYRTDLVAGADEAADRLQDVAEAIEARLNQALLANADTIARHADQFARWIGSFSDGASGVRFFSGAVDDLTDSIARLEGQIDTAPTANSLIARAERAIGGSRRLTREEILAEIARLNAQRAAAVADATAERDRERAAAAVEGIGRVGARAAQAQETPLAKAERIRSEALTEIKERARIARDLGRFDIEAATRTKEAKLAVERQFQAEKQKLDDQAAKEAEAASKKGLSEAKKEAGERKRLLEQIAEAKRKAELAGLDEIQTVEKERDQQVAQFAAAVAEQQDAAELLAEFRVAQEQIAADKIADIRQKAAEKAEKDAEREREKAQREIDKQLEEQRRAVEGVVTDISGLLASGLVEGFAAGKDAAFDWGEAVSGIIKRLAADLLQAFLVQGVVGPILGVQPSSSSSPGSGLLSLLVGGGTGGGVVGAGAQVAHQSGLLGRVLGVGGGTGISNTPTFGIPSLLYRALGLGGVGGSVVWNAPQILSGLNAAAAASPLGFQLGTTIGPQITGFTPTTLTAAAQSSATAPANIGAGASGLSTITAGIGALIALGLAAKGLVDSRSAFGDVTLGTAPGKQNLLTGVGSGIIAGTTIGGTLIGTAISPGIGTLVGAGVGAATGAAIEQAISKGVTKGISDSVRQGLNQQGLEKTIAAETGDDLVLNLLSGYANKVFIADILGPAFAPSIERIFAKVFRQVIGGTGGLDTAGVTGSGFYGLGANRAQAGQASRIIAQAFGAGGEAFGSEREGNFVSILLGGVRKRINKEGGDAGQIIAETFAAAFNGKFLNALSAIFSERKGLRDADAKFAAEQFAKGSPAFGFDYQRVVDAATEGERVPGKPARRRSREVLGEAFAAGIQDPADPQAFARAAQQGFVGVAAEEFTKALSKSSLGIGLADVFAPDRDERRAVRRARRTGGVEAAFGELSKQFAENTAEFVDAVSDPAYAKAIATFTDELLKLGVAVSEATGDTAAARAQIDQRLAPYTGQVEAIDQLGRDIDSRSRFALAGPGFAGSQAQIEELQRQREEAARVLRNSSVFDGQLNLNDADRTLIDRNLGNVNVKGIPADEIGQAADEFAQYAQARLAELEAEIALQRQIVDLLEQATDALHGMRAQAQQVLGTFDPRAETARQIGRAQTDFAAARAEGYQDPVTLQRFLGSLSQAISTTAGRVQFLGGASDSFTGLADQLALATGGRREGRRQLRERQAELAGLVPAALAGGAGADDAIAELQRLLPELLQLGQGVLSPGAFRRLQREIEGQARVLGISTGGAEDIAREQLTALERLAAEAEGGAGTALGDANVKLEEIKGELELFTANSKALLDLLGAGAKNVLAEKLGEVARLLGGTGSGASEAYLATIAARYGLPARAAGGPTYTGQTYMVGEFGPEPWVAPANGYIYPNGTRFAAPAAARAPQRVELVVTVRHVTNGAAPTLARASLNGRTLGSTDSQQMYDLLRKLGVAA